MVVAPPVELRAGAVGATEAGVFFVASARLAYCINSAPTLTFPSGFNDSQGLVASTTLRASAVALAAWQCWPRSAAPMPDVRRAATTVTPRRPSIVHVQL